MPVDRACELLVLTEERIQQISLDGAFHDQFYVDKCFRKSQDVDRVSIAVGIEILASDIKDCPHQLTAFTCPGTL